MIASSRRSEFEKLVRFNRPIDFFVGLDEICYPVGTMHPFSFRETHLFRLIESYEEQKLPLDRVVSDYFRQHRSLGAQDRRVIGHLLYELFRWQETLDYLGAHGSWLQRYRLLMQQDPRSLIGRSGVPLHIQCGLPSALFDQMTRSLGVDQTLKVGLISNEQAPTTIRVNVLKTTRDQLLHRWRGWGARACKLSDVGIVLPKREALLTLPEFKQGWFELQDEGSQLVAAQVAVKPGDLVMDFCAGSGGKSLALAPRMRGKGQLFLYDVRKNVLKQAKARLARAGVQHAQLMLDERQLQRWLGKMDWVLVDAPCSGTGTMRRNVDMKWRFTIDSLQRLIQSQQEILLRASKFLKPTGRLVYATCSVLDEENREQVQWFQQCTDWKQVGTSFVAMPMSGGMDGFFAVVLAR